MAPRIPVVKKDVGFPVYALAWRNDDVMIASGGGGVGNFGVKNKIVNTACQGKLFDVDCCQSREPCRGGYYDKREHCV